jgi:hypothetical protein
LQRDDRGQAVFVVGGADGAAGLDRQQAAAAGDDVACGFIGVSPQQTPCAVPTSTDADRVIAAGLAVRADLSSAAAAIWLWGRTLRLGR